MLIKQNKRLFNLKIPQSLKVVYVWKKGLAIFVNKRFRKDDKFFLKGKFVNATNSTPKAVEISKDKFIDTKYLVPEDFINHSCSPNTKLDTEKNGLLPLKILRKMKG